MGWQGDELLSTHPCFIVTESLKNDIILNGLTGAIFKSIAMTFSDEFYDICGDVRIPKFVQIICNDSYEEFSKLDLKNYGFMPNMMPENAQGIPARITAVHKERYELVCEYGETHGRLKTKEYFGGFEEFPTTGDFVRGCK